jgi:hypothetical protein
MAQVNNGIPPLAQFYFWFLTGVLLSLIAVTLLHWHLRHNLWRWCLWMVTGLLIFAALAGFDLFVLLVPTVLLALVAALAAYPNRPTALA